VTLVFAVGAFRDATPIPRRTKKLMDRINSECVIRFTFTQSRRGGRRGGFSRLMLMPRCLHTWPPGMAAEAAPKPATVSLRRDRPRRAAMRFVRAEITIRVQQLFGSADRRGYRSGSRPYSRLYDRSFGNDGVRGFRGSGRLVCRETIC
jgi:hypothetical protein